MSKYIKEIKEKEFFEKFGANKIWVKPSRDNVETILDIWKFMQDTIDLAVADRDKEIVDNIWKLEIHTDTDANFIRNEILELVKVKPTLKNLSGIFEFKNLDEDYYKEQDYL